MNKPLAAAFLALLGAGAAHAQAGHSPRVLALPASVRAAAMGGAFMLAGGDADAVFYNPAAMDSAGGVGVQAARWGTAATGVAAAGSAGSAANTFGFGVRALTYGAPGADVSAQPGGERSLALRGPTGASELAATVAYGRKLAGTFRVGLGATLLQERVGGAEDAGWGVDVGGTAKVGPVIAGLAATGLGPALRIGGAKAKLPSQVTLGASLPRTDVGPLDVGAAAAVTRLAGGRVVPGAGVEVAYWPVAGRTFVGRVGVRRGDTGEPTVFTFGGGLAWDRFSVDYAYRGLGGEGAAHRVGITWR
jgi:hypothetical protein